MFLFRDPIRLDKPEPLDPVQAELERRILFAPPGHTGPFPTYEEVRAELARLEGRRAPKAPALALAEAGFDPPVRVVVVYDLDGGVERIERAETAIQPPPESAKAEQFRPLGGPDFDAENVECGRKDTTGEVLPDLVATDAENVDVFGFKNSSSEADVQVTPSLLGKGETSPKHQQKLQRPRRQSKPKPDFLSETGSKPKTKPKADSKSKAKAAARSKARTKAAAKAKAKSKPKRERKKTISPDERDLAELCFFMAQALGCPFNMKADLAPGHLDHLSVEGRIQFCLKIIKNLRAYIRSRRIARGMPESWWPDVWGWVRESDPRTNLKEHVHLVFYAPEDERRPMVDLMEEKRKSTNPKVKRWCPNAKFALIDSYEHWTGAKFESALGYFVKMANPENYHPDPTIGYKKSGFITGPRIKFSPFLTDPERVEAHRIDVQALKRVRDGNRAIMRANGSKPARDPRSLFRASRSAPVDVHAEIVPVEVPAMPAPAQVLVSAALVPAVVEPAIFLTPGSAGLVHRDEEERREMDVVEVETRLDVPTEPVPIPREPAAAMVEVPVEAVTPAAPAASEAVVYAEDAAPPLPVTPAAGLATPIPAIMPVIDPITAAVLRDAMAEPSPPASSQMTPRLAPFAVLGRAMAGGVMAGVGWVSSRLGVRAPPHPATATPARGPRAPFIHPSAFVAVSALFGAPILW